MKVLIVTQTELPHGSDKLHTHTCGVAINTDQVRSLIETAIAARNNSQKLERWIHPTILFFSIEEREIGVFNSFRTFKVWNKDDGFLPIILE